MFLGGKLHFPPLEFLHNHGEAVDISTREAPLDTVFLALYQGTTFVGP
jgi:hypothetical protein